MVALVSALSLTLTQAMLMALPPQSDEDLQAHAQRVVVVQVLEVTHKDVAVRDGTDRVFTAKVKPAGSDGGEGAPFAVTFRQTWKRPQGWTGPAGQNSVLEAGTRVRLFLERGDDGGWQLLEPNGWAKVE